MALDATLQLLAEHMVFAVLEREALRLVAFAAERKEVAAGSVLFDQGTATDAAYLVTEGEIELVSVRADQAEHRQIVGAGALLAESALLSQSLHAATATARTSAVLMRLPRAAYRRVLEEFPKSAIDLRRRLAERLLSTVAGLEQARINLES